MPEYDINQITVTSNGNSVTANLHDSQIPDVNAALEAILDGGGGSEIFAHLYVIAGEGSVVTATSQGATYTETAGSGGEAFLQIGKPGTYTITANKDGRTSFSETITVAAYGGIYTCALEYPSIYGASWVKLSGALLTRTDDAASFVDPDPYVADGSHLGSSPFDNLMPWAGMVKETIDGNVLVKIPKFWYKITNSSNELKFQIANYPAEGFKVSPAHADREDGKGERDYVYIGRYKCNYNYKSTTNSSSKVSITRATARSNITALGSGYYIQDFAMFWTVRMLYIVEFASWNSQYCIGIGLGGISVPTGYTDLMPYHTGTIQGSRTDSGAGIQYRWIEGLWDSVYEFIDGIRLQYGRVYVYKNPANYSDSSSTGSVNVGKSVTDSGWISNFFVPSDSDYDWALYPNSTSGLSIGDRYDYYDDGTVLRTGGSNDQYSNSYVGLFYMTNNFGASSYGSNTGVRLELLP